MVLPLGFVYFRTLRPRNIQSIHWTTLVVLTIAQQIDGVLFSPSSACIRPQSFSSHFRTCLCRDVVVDLDDLTWRRLGPALDVIHPAFLSVESLHTHLAVTCSYACSWRVVYSGQPTACESFASGSVIIERALRLSLLDRLLCIFARQCASVTYSLTVCTVQPFWTLSFSTPRVCEISVAYTRRAIDICSFGLVALDDEMYPSLRSHCDDVASLSSHHTLV
jgi:hypothetical protein